MARSLAELCLDRLAMQAPLDRSLPPDQLSAAAGLTVTDKGIGAEEALRLWEQVLAPACLSVDHPRYLSFIPGAPTKASAAFDMLVGASSVYGGTWLEGSGAVYAENQALRWIADLVGMPEGAGGVFVQGGTIGNLSALVAAREAARYRREGGPPARWAVVVTDETHSSVKHSLQVVMDVEVVTVPGDERGRLTGANIRARLAELSQAETDAIFAVVGSAGTTNSGVIDDLAGIAEVARERGWWFHVDGAYGGAGVGPPPRRRGFRRGRDPPPLPLDPPQRAVPPPRRRSPGLP